MPKKPKLAYERLATALKTYHKIDTKVQTCGDACVLDSDCQVAGDQCTKCNIFQCIPSPEVHAGTQTCGDACVLDSDCQIAGDQCKTCNLFQCIP